MTERLPSQQPEEEKKQPQAKPAERSIRKDLGEVADSVASNLTEGMGSFSDSVDEMLKDIPEDADKWEFCEHLGKKLKENAHPAAQFASMMLLNARILFGGEFSFGAGDFMSKSRARINEGDVKQPEESARQKIIAMQGIENPDIKGDKIDVASAQYVAARLWGMELGGEGANALKPRNSVDLFRSLMAMEHVTRDEEGKDKAEDFFDQNADLAKLKGQELPRGSVMLFKKSMIGSFFMAYATGNGDEIEYYDPEGQSPGIKKVRLSDDGFEYAQHFRGALLPKQMDSQVEDEV